MNKMKILFYGSVACFFLSSLTILFMPMVSIADDGNPMPAYILASAFWFFLAAGIVITILIGIQRKKDKSYTDKGGIALLRFFTHIPKNKPGLIFDLLLAIGVITLSLSSAIRTMPDWMILGGTFTAMLSLEMHGVLGGKNYEWIFKSR